MNAVDDDDDDSKFTVVNIQREREVLEIPRRRR